MSELIFISPVFKEMIWGSENWVISAHPNGDCKVTGGAYKGSYLSELWSQHPELFGRKVNAKTETSSVYPLLIKIIDAKQDLSIQVHPDDAYAAVHEHGSLGKTECWYILDCDKDASIVIGHHARNKDEVKQMIEEKRWEDFIRVVPIHKGDFFQIDPGCVHAIKGGTLVFETQQNSDITYRVYDFDRLSDGKPRELHIQQSIDTIKAPFEEQAQADIKTCQMGDAVWTHLITCSFYSVDKYDIDGTFEYEFEGAFTNVSVLEGIGTINGLHLEKGDNFIIPCGYGTCKLSGTLSIMCSRT